MEDPIEAIDRLTRDLEKAGTGDKVAFQRVYDHTCKKLFGICLAVVRDRALAEDVLQEAFVKVWQRAGQYERDKASPVTWLCVIARNSAIDRRRSLERTPSGSDDLLPWIADERESAHQHIEALQTKAGIFACLDELEENQRVSISAAFFDGLTYLELATQRAVPLGTMKSWVRRGLARLKKCLDDHD